MDLNSHFSQINFSVNITIQREVASERNRDKGGLYITHSNTNDKKIELDSYSSRFTSKVSDSMANDFVKKVNGNAHDILEPSENGVASCNNIIEENAEFLNNLGAY